MYTCALLLNPTLLVVLLLGAWPGTGCSLLIPLVRGGKGKAKGGWPGPEGALVLLICLYLPLYTPAHSGIGGGGGAPGASPRRA
jgi:hypothetical protein